MTDWAGIRRFLGSGTYAVEGHPCRRRVALTHKPSLEGLEGRRLPAGLVPQAVTVSSATTADSLGVTVGYDVKGDGAATPLTFSVYRSATPQLNSSSLPVGTETISPTSQAAPIADDAGSPATAAGHHTLTIPLAGGLPPNPLHPFVVVVANPGSPETVADPASHTAAFRKHTVAVIVHGGLQPRYYRNVGPPWERKLAMILRRDGYDTVLPFNWVGPSYYPGQAAKEGPRVADLLVRTSNLYPANEPVDLHLIGHSEGAVVTSVALKRLMVTATPQIKAGYIVDTMLDPHAANNNAPGGRQFSERVGYSYKGWLAKQAIRSYQYKAQDPVVSVPANVDAAQVYYQRTPNSLSRGTNHGLYNLWGQVPVIGKATYFNLTGPGITHSGDFSVPTWYNLNVAPGLGNGAINAGPRPLAGAPVHGNVSATHRVPVAGTAEPGAYVHVSIQHGKGHRIPAGAARADANGQWSLTTRPLRNGTYRLLGQAIDPANPSRPRVHVTPRARLGTLTVDTTGLNREG